MVSGPDLQRLLAGNGIVVDRQGNKIGSAEQLYVDDQSGAPEWVTVKTGLFGTSESFVPLAHSEVRGEELWVAYDKLRPGRLARSRNRRSPHGRPGSRSLTATTGSPTRLVARRRPSSRVTTPLAAMTPASPPTTP